jgi:hypothetical protein
MRRFATKLSTFVAVTLAQGAGGVPAARAQPSAQPQEAVKDVARQRYTAGVKAFDAGQFEEARTAFLEAYQLTEAPGILFNLGLSEVKTNRTVEGCNHLLKFLRQYAEASAEQRTTAQKSIDDCKKQAALVTVTVDVAGAQISLDGKAVGAAPLLDPLFVEPGMRTFSATDGGNTATATVDARGGASAEAALRLRTVVGGIGETCRARSDCGEGLKCVANVCQDERQGQACQADTDCGTRLACIDAVCAVRPKPSGGAEAERPSKGLEGTRAHLGVMLGGGPTHTDRTFLGVEGSLLFSIKGGVLLDRSELGLEFSPASFVLAFDPDVPLVQLNAYVGYHIPLAGPVSWPMRFGAGFSHFAPASGRSDDITLEGRADLVGASILVDPILIDIFLPSFRVNTDLSRAHFFTYVFGAGASWLPN